MPTGDPPSVASQVVRRSPSRVSQVAMRFSKSGSAPAPALHTERNDAIAPMSPVAATRTTTSGRSEVICTVLADRHGGVPGA
jgi:hypothetical protein